MADDTMMKSQQMVEGIKSESSAQKQQAMQQIGQTFLGVAPRIMEVERHRAAQQHMQEQEQLAMMHYAIQVQEQDRLERKFAYYEREALLRERLANVRIAETQLGMMEKQLSMDPYFQTASRGRFPTMQKNGQTLVGRYEGKSLIWEEATPDTLRLIQRETESDRIRAEAYRDQVGKQGDGGDDTLERKRKFVEKALTGTGFGSQVPQDMIEWAQRWKRWDIGGRVGPEPKIGGGGSGGALDSLIDKAKGRKGQ